MIIAVVTSVSMDIIIISTYARLIIVVCFKSKVLIDCMFRIFYTTPGLV